MRLVVQRVERALVNVDERTIAQIAQGCLVLVGVGKDDNESDADYLADKVRHLRIYEDDGGRMNATIEEIGGQVLSVSQFTLYGDCRRGRRPNFTEAAEPEAARALYDRFNQRLREGGISVETGEFGAHMKVELCNDGPVTLLLDSGRSF